MSAPQRTSSNHASPHDLLSQNRSRFSGVLVPGGNILRWLRRRVRRQVRTRRDFQTLLGSRVGNSSAARGEAPELRIRR
ncbi:UNVERIFIED_CONTAM: hypothetical protein Sradi_5621900 [Sesamum radiatum]|uniref:Uncharacterized protein n=1 Tax=Sesamum radiatum TaxID=300843 RepID=A0AAW2KYT0_SESRA